jgi:hypothetical protein
MGSAILCWFLGSIVAPPIKHGTVFLQAGSQYALFAFLLVPALILAVVALFWVPPRIAGEASLPEGDRWRLALVLLFVVAFALGWAHGAAMSG